MGVGEILLFAGQLIRGQNGTRLLYWILSCSKILMLLPGHEILLHMFYYLCTWQFTKKNWKSVVRTSFLYNNKLCQSDLSIKLINSQADLLVFQCLWQIYDGSLGKYDLVVSDENFVCRDFGWSDIWVQLFGWSDIWVQLFGLSQD